MSNGIDYFEYEMAFAERLKMINAVNRDKIIVAVSGGFDPPHVGHLRMFDEAKKYGDELVVILNNDHWLRKKKGFVFMPEEERSELIAGFGSVDRVYLSQHSKNSEDMTVCQELKVLQPDIFCNGGDRKKETVPEYKLCEVMGIEMKFNVGGEKVQSSSNLVEGFLNEGKENYSDH